jgi:hypothetical protein
MNAAAGDRTTATIHGGRSDADAAGPLARRRGRHRCPERLP